MTDQQGSRPGPSRALAALGLSVAPVALLCAVRAPVFATPPDDFVQELFARGQFMAADAGGLMPYSLAPVSLPLSALYGVAPSFPWYAASLLALIIACFAIAWHLLLSADLGRGRTVSAGAVLIACEAVCTWYLTYTIVAFIALAAGLSIVVSRALFGGGPARGDGAGSGRGGLDRGGYSGGRKPADAPVPVPSLPRFPLSDAAGLALVGCGFSMRPESGMAALVVFAPFAAYALARRRRPRVALRALSVLAVIALCWVAGQLAYRISPGWEGYPDYLDAGRSVLDTQPISADEVRSAVPGLSENDVEMMYNWDFVDHDLFDTDAFRAIGDRTSSFGSVQVAEALKAKTTYALIAVAVLFAAAALVASSALHLDRAGRALMLGVAAMVLLDLALVVLRGRPRLHVIVPIVVTAVFALLVCCRAPRRYRGRHGAAPAAGPGRPRSRVAPVAVCALCALAVAGFWHVGIRPLQERVGGLEFADAVDGYVRDHPDEIVVFVNTQATWFSARDAFSSASWRCPSNVVFVGGWESGTPAWASAMARMGLDAGAPLMRLADRDDMVGVMQPQIAACVETYLREHVDDSVRARRVADLGPGAVDPGMISVYRFERS